MLSSETALWAAALGLGREPGWGRTQTRTLLVSLLIKGGDVRTCFITCRECPLVNHLSEGRQEPTRVSDNQQQTNGRTINSHTTEQQLYQGWSCCHERWTCSKGFWGGADSLRALRCSAPALGPLPPTISIIKNKEESNTKYNITFTSARILLNYLQTPEGPLP